MATKTEPNEILQSVAPQLDAMAKNLLQQVYGEEGLPWGTPFSELEDVSMELAHHLARSLMQQAAQNQATQQIPEGYEVCPGCSKPVEKAAPRDRPLTTRAGEIEWSEPKRYCRKCRQDFFPSGEVSST